MGQFRWILSNTRSLTIFDKIELEKFSFFFMFFRGTPKKSEEVCIFAEII